MSLALHPSAPGELLTPDQTSGSACHFSDSELDRTMTLACYCSALLFICLFFCHMHLFHGCVHVIFFSVTVPCMHNTHTVIHAHIDVYICWVKTEARNHNVTLTEKDSE